MKVLMVFLSLILITLGIKALGDFKQYYSMHIAPFRGRTFEKELWMASEQGKTDYQQAELDMQCIRGSMVADLKDHYLNSNTTKVEVIELLGEANAPRKDTKNCLKYDLGMCSGYKMDYDTLNICFDKNDKFINAYTQQS